MKVLRLVQGDTFDLTLTISGEQEVLEEISKVYFSCQNQKLKEECIKLYDGKYSMTIPAEKTKSFTPRISSFDVTVVFNDGEILTGRYENKLEILRKFSNIG